ncbi:HzsA-related protein [Ideonella dechloratans]|uniref:HzsA-related protein n=1 Tax=Ideonella dechloratans TaxID=36863 RepID=UPI0035B3F563
MKPIHLPPPGLRLAAAGLLAALGVLAGCSGSTSGSGTATVAGDVPLVYVKRADTLNLNPTDGAPFAPGGDLMLREKSSPSAPEHNLTQQFTQGKGDVSGPEVSYDAKKVVFAMRCPSSNTSRIDGVAACTGRWNLWEYDMSSGGLTGGSFRRLTASTTDDDVDPVYLPGHRGFVFTSNRQTKSHLDQALGRSYYALDEYERQRVFNLHTMDADGGTITQISFNQSHDRSPVIRPNGDIMFSRWDHVGDRNHFKVFRMKPDGTDMFVLYGAHSEGNTYLHPRDMDPAGKYAGYLSTDAMPLQRTKEGGALLLIDAANYSEQNTPANSTVPTTGGQQQLTAQELNMDRGFSRYGRVTTPYPLWDGTNRLLLAYKPCEVTRNGEVTPCAKLSSDEIARLEATDRTKEELAADTVQDNVPPHYAIYMFDPAQQTWLVVAAPPAGFMYIDPVALQARTEPHTVEATNVDADLAAQNLGLLEVRSVYDTDGLGRMGDAVLGAADLKSGCTTAIAKTTPTDALDTRPQVADLIRMKNPADSAYGCSPARFVRAVRAVAPPANTMNLREAIGETNFEPQQILGYAPIEPDGSFKLVVPADTPIGLAVVDSEGRAFQTHTNWIQIRPGERRTCDGCHSPRRGASLNSGSIVDTMPSALRSALASAHLSGETMASTRTRLDANALKLVSDLIYQDVWADTTQAGVSARPAISLRYTGNADPSQDLATPVPTDGIINYPEHIQPLWTRNRGSNTCTNCHNASAGLNLLGTVAGSGRLASYDELLIGDPVIDPSTGLPKTQLKNGVPEVVRQPALVETGASEGDALGLARKSRLMEILAGTLLMSAADAQTAHPTPTTVNHAGMLNAAEKRLLAEWMDLGGKYYNDPFNANAGVRTISTLSQDSFEAKVLPILNSTCATYCHMGVGSGAGKSFIENRFVLTGDPEGDYNVALTMISDTCNPASNTLLSKPSTIPHPSGATGQTTAVLPAGGTDFATIVQWIATGCPTP